MAKELGDRRRLAWAVMWQTVPKAALSGPESVPKLVEAARSSVEVLRELGDKAGVTQGLNIIGESLRVTGDLAAAERVYLELIPIAREIGDYRRVVFQYANLAAIAYERREAEAMLRYVRLGLPLSRQHRVDETLTLSFILIAVLCHWAGRDERAGRLVGAADAWYEDMSVTPQAVDVPIETRMKAEVRRGMGEPDFSQAWARGRAMSQAEAITLAEDEIAVLDALAASGSLKAPQKNP
jgi:hypothetical protein